MELKSLIEAMLFASQKPLTARELRQAFAATAEQLPDDAVAQEHKNPKLERVEAVLAGLAEEYDQSPRCMRLVCVAGAWQLVNAVEYAPWIRALVGEKQRPARLSQPALETLAIIAYRQPITRAEIEQIRGVSVDGTMQTLLERELVEQTGKAEVVGRPALYGTTALFLEYFGLANLEGLPAADELRRLPVHRPEALETAEPGLATVPPEQLKFEDARELVEATAGPSEEVVASADESSDAAEEDTDADDDDDEEDEYDDEDEDEDDEDEEDEEDDEESERK